ncbi:MAG TPA: amidohydrolase [Streptosporangiaceae bacterium]
MTATDWIARAVDERAKVFIELSDQIWDNPELRWQEFDSVAAQRDLAASSGFRITGNVAGIPTAFCAEHGSGGPVIAILGEFDSLAGLSQESGVARPQPDPANTSGNGQGCGHHLLGTASLLAAVAVARHLDDQGLPGRVRYYGCPAEEAAAGKTFMVKGGAFADVDAAVSWHPASVTGVTRSHSLAYCQAYFGFRGTPSHAGVSPHLGRSALDAGELMNIGVNFLREHMPTDCRVHYAFVDAGGPSPNVVQSSARLYYIVRAPNVPDMRSLYERVVKIAEGAALMTETALEVEFDGGCSELLGNDALEQAMSEEFARLGPVPFDDDDRARAEPFLATVGAAELARTRTAARIPAGDTGSLHAGVTPLQPGADRPTMGGSTDVGDVSWVVPTVQCTTAVAALGTPGHSWQLTGQGKLPAAHKGMLHAAKVMGATAARMLSDAGLLAAARAEFGARLAERPYDCPIPDGVTAPPLRAR